MEHAAITYPKRARELSPTVRARLAQIAAGTLRCNATHCRAAAVLLRQDRAWCAVHGDNDRIDRQVAAQREVMRIQRQRAYERTVNGTCRA